MGASRNMGKSAIQNDVVNRIRQLRVDNDVSQIELANIIDVSIGQIGNIESLRFRHKYTLKQLYLIANYFKVSVEYLLTGSNEKLSTDDLVKAIVQYDG